MTEAHSWKLIKYRCSKNVRKLFFSYRVSRRSWTRKDKDYGSVTELKSTGSWGHQGESGVVILQVSCNYSERQKFSKSIVPLLGKVFLLVGRSGPPSSTKSVLCGKFHSKKINLVCLDVLVQNTNITQTHTDRHTFKTQDKPDCYQGQLTCVCIWHYKGRDLSLHT